MCQYGMNTCTSCSQWYWMRVWEGITVSIYLIIDIYISNLDIYSWVRIHASREYTALYSIPLYISLIIFYHSCIYLWTLTLLITMDASSSILHLINMPWYHIYTFIIIHILLIHLHVHYIVQYGIDDMTHIKCLCTNIFAYLDNDMKSVNYVIVIPYDMGCKHTNHKVIQTIYMIYIQFIFWLIVHDIWMHDINHMNQYYISFMIYTAIIYSHMAQ